MNGSRVSTALMLIAALAAAADAGWPGENGTGALWIAADLVESPAPSPSQTCARTAAVARRELVFETIELEAEEMAAVPDAVAREVVDFDWNPTTGELGFRATARTAVFSDLVSWTPASFATPPNCGSH